MRTRTVVAAWIAVLALGAGAGCKNLFPHRSQGETLWRKQCADCHGLDGAGNTAQYMGNPWADLTDDHWKTGGGDESSFESVVHEGVFGEMRGFPELSHQEILALYEYLRVLRHEKPAADTTP